jgi:hypothetical protein
VLNQHRPDLLLKEFILLKCDLLSTSGHGQQADNECAYDDRPSLQIDDPFGNI